MTWISAEYTPACWQEKRSSGHGIDFYFPRYNRPHAGSGAPQSTNRAGMLWKSQNRHPRDPNFSAGKACLQSMPLGKFADHRSLCVNQTGRMGDKQNGTVAERISTRLDFARVPNIVLVAESYEIALRMQGALHEIVREAESRIVSQQAHGNACFPGKFGHYRDRCIGRIVIRDDDFTRRVRLSLQAAQQRRQILCAVIGGQHHRSLWLYLIP